MIDNNKSRRARIWHAIFIASLFIASAGLLYFAIPGEGRFRYEFQKGRPWMHETLIAPFDFAIQKSEMEIKAEKDSLLQSLLPYFNRKDSIQMLKTDQLSAQLDELLMADEHSVNQVKALKAPIIELFTAVYNDGVLAQSPGLYPELKGKDAMMILQNRVGKQIPTQQLYSLKSAYRHILTEINVLKGRFPEQRAFLDQIQPETFLEPNLVFNEKTTRNAEAKLLENISLTRGMVQEGERIVSQGDLINTHIHRILESLRDTYEKSYGDLSNYYLIILGRILFIVLLLLSIFLFIYNIRYQILQSKRDMTFTLLVMVAMVYLCRVIGDIQALDIYLVPFTALALMVRTFIDARLAIFVNFITALFVGFLVPNGYEFVLLQVLAGTVAIISQDNLQRRGQLVITTVFTVLTYAATFLAISLIQEGNLTTIEWEKFRWFIGNGILTLITYLLLYIFEKSFGFVSDVTLVELAYSNQPLLRKLSEEAPGTFQHSMQVANLAEEAILKLGGNQLLVRAGALYHDIGKIAKAHYFTENQSTGIDPHENLTPEESAAAIMKHIDEGVELARKHKLPQQLIDFIQTHHGTSKTGYFYVKTKNQNHGKVIDESKFTYNGPRPSTKETAVVMLADGIEAASRSLTEKNEETLRDLIEKIFNSKLNDGQLELAPLTFQDITLLKQLFLDKLKNIYHVRVAYPEEKKHSNKK